MKLDDPGKSQKYSLALIISPLPFIPSRQGRGNFTFYEIDKLPAFKKRRPAWRMAVLFLCLFLFPFLPRPEAAEPRVWNLQGISGFQVVVEGLTKDGREAGISENAVRSQVKALFQASLSQVPLDKADGPSLYVQILLYKRQKEDLYYGMVSVGVDRPVIVLSAPQNFPAFSQVWENTIVFSGKDPLLGTYEILAKLVNLLIEDYKKANP